jgi:Icc-related predicted phosphoesterase
MGKVYITGDTHGSIDIAKFNTLKKNVTLNKDDAILIAGDFGGIFSRSRDIREVELECFYKELNCDIYFCLGNHENTDRLYSDEFKTIFDKKVNGKVKKIFHNVFMLFNNSVYTINSKTYYIFGGAASQDKQYRIPKISWWAEEIPSKKDFKKALRTAKNLKVDYILAHAAPLSFIKQLYETTLSDAVSDMLEILIDKIDYKMLICGHYHVNICSKELKVVTLYNMIFEEPDLLKEVEYGGVFLRSV